MLQNLIEFSIRNKFIAFMLAAVIIITGLFSAAEIPLDAVPDITNNQVQVITQAPTLATQEVEQLVTTPLERTLSNIPGQIELRSISRFGLSVITVVFSDETDPYLARQLVQEQLITARQELANLATPELAPMTTGLGEIYQYYLETKPEFEQYYTLQ
ncbi:MAG: efflux RND transporter permease subunit, partial [Flexibacteraceae bacterium]